MRLLAARSVTETERVTRSFGIFLLDIVALVFETTRTVVYLR